MNVETVVTIVSALVAIASAWLAYEQRRVMTNVASFDRMTSAESILQTSPARLLELHGVPADVPQQIGLASEEIHYLIQNFAASEFFHRLDPLEGVQLTAYRRNLLRNPKVRAAWTRVIRDHFLSPGPFSTAVDDYVERLESDATHAGAHRAA